MDKAFGIKGTINPLNIVTHPIDTIESLKDKKIGSIISASIILLLFTESCHFCHLRLKFRNFSIHFILK